MSNVKGLNIEGYNQWHEIQDRQFKHLSKVYHGAVVNTDLD